MSARPPSAGARPPSASATSSFPGSLSDLVSSFEAVKQKAPHRMANLEQVHKLLASSYADMPQPQDTEKCVPVYHAGFLRATRLFSRG
jgi:CCR4-NOT transcription complex subunit 3